MWPRVAITSLCVQSSDPFFFKDKHNNDHMYIYTTFYSKSSYVGELHAVEFVNLNIRIEEGDH